MVIVNFKTAVKSSGWATGLAQPAQFDLELYRIEMKRRKVNKVQRSLGSSQVVAIMTLMWPNMSL